MRFLPVRPACSAPLPAAYHLALGQQAVLYGNNPAAGHYAAVRGVKLYYETHGAGSPLLLLHGNGGSSKEVHKTIPYFARKYRVIALDSLEATQTWLRTQL